MVYNKLPNNIMLSACEFDTTLFELAAIWHSATEAFSQFHSSEGDSYFASMCSDFMSLSSFNVK